MNRPFEALRIRTQLMVVTGAAIGISLTIAGAVIAISDYHAGHDTLTHRLHTQADVIAINSSAAMAFDDPEAATRTLRGLSADQAIVDAELLRSDGSALARQTFGDRSRTDANLLTVTSNVMLPQRIGSVRLRASTAEMKDALTRQLGLLFAILAAALLVCLTVAGCTELSPDPSLRWRWLPLA